MLIFSPFLVVFWSVYWRFWVSFIPIFNPIFGRFSVNFQSNFGQFLIDFALIFESIFGQFFDFLHIWFNVDVWTTTPLPSVQPLRRRRRRRRRSPRRRWWTMCFASQGHQSLDIRRTVKCRRRFHWKFIYLSIMLPWRHLSIKQRRQISNQKK